MRALRLYLWLGAAAVAVGMLAGSGAAASTRPAQPARAPAIVVRGFHWLGFGKDRVGPTEARPNGERDGRFSVVLAASRRVRVISSVSLWSCVHGDCPVPFASTPYAPLIGPKFFAKGAEAVTVLGVRAGGKLHRIDARRKASWLRVPVARKGLRLDVYVNDGPGCLQAPTSRRPDSCHHRWFTDHRLGPHERFQIAFTVKGGRTVRSEWLTTPGLPPTMKQPVALGAFRYAGLDRDVAGSTYGSPPDGKPEAHFRLDFTASRGPGTLWNVVLTRTPVGGWSNTLPAPLTVFLDGRKLDPPTRVKNPFDEAVWDAGVDLRWSSARHRLDLYAYDNSHHAGDPNWEPFAPGSRFTATVFVLLPYYVRLGGAYAETSTTVP